jgi:hypothetical protein
VHGFVSANSAIITTDIADEVVQENPVRVMPLVLPRNARELTAADRATTLAFDALET